MKYFVCADPHSHTSILQDAVHDAGFRKYKDDHRLVVCGDIFDRGKEPVEMYHYLRGLGDKLIFIRGNHEDLLKHAYLEYKHSGRVESPEHHYNKTAQTVCKLDNEGYLEEVIDWIDEKAVDFYETDHYVFVHGWIPCKEVDKFGKELRTVYLEDWRDPEFMHSTWFSARWFNGMEEWHAGIKVPGKTVVCGHWHCGFGNYYYHGETIDSSSSWIYDDDDEYYLSDHPFIDDGIIALDTCTALTKKINVVEIED